MSLEAVTEIQNLTERLQECHLSSLGARSQGVKRTRFELFSKTNSSVFKRVIRYLIAEQNYKSSWWKHSRQLQKA